jgi:superfamily II DNA or RNA helicase
MGVDIIDRLRLTTLILTHTTVIMNQWIEHLYNDLCIDEVGVIGGGRKNVCPVTVAMVQTLQKFSDTNFDKLRRLFSCLICDEAHHVPAYTFLKIIANFSPEYLYGLTATPERKDEKEFLLYDFMGPIRYRLSDEVLVSAGRITDVEVKWLETDCAIYNDEWHIMVSALIYIPRRNQMIVNEMIKAVEAGHSILMLSERVAHCGIIAGMLNDRGIKNVCLAGDSRIPQELLAGFSKDYNIIVASMAIAKEGLDIPAISCIVLASPSNNEHVLKQMIGRGRRQKDKETLVIDIDDKKAPMFSSMAKNRSKWYEQWNFRQDVEDKENNGFSMFEGAKYRPGARQK